MKLITYVASARLRFGIVPVYMKNRRANLERARRYLDAFEWRGIA